MGDIMRIIFHVDVNNAFLSWSAIDLLSKGYETDIRTIPSIIGGDEEKRHGIVLAKSPIAKSFGVKTAETIYMARKKCPNLLVFPPNYEFYVEESHKFYNYLKEYTPVIEQASIDECFLDLTGTNYLYDDILKLAYKIKNDIKDKFGFTVNVGIANNKLCAKMASDFLKPDRVHTLFDYEIKDKMWPLPINDLLFVGKSSTKELEKIGIKTIGDLANFDSNKLYKIFKNQAYDLIRRANGIDNSEVIVDYGNNKCISISRTLPEDTLNKDYLKRILLDMSNQVGLRARRNKLYAKNIAVTYKLSSFKSYSHGTKLHNPTNNTMDIYNKVIELFNDIEFNDKIRSIGVRLSDLSIDNFEQVSLFDNRKLNNEVQEIMDNINSKYKNTVVMPAIFFKSSNNK